MRVLVVAAHPDDEVLGCGGTIARLAEEGNEVSIYILNKGRLGDKALVMAYNSIRILRAQNITLDDLPDQRYDSIDFLDIVRSIERKISEKFPHTIYTHFIHDLNLDHSLIAKAVLTASRPMSDCCVKRIYSFESPSSTEWNFTQGFTPNMFMNIENFIEKKLDAFKCYETEMREFPHPRSKKSLYNRASYWGSVSGFQHAEAFQLVREIM